MRPSVRFFGTIIIFILVAGSAELLAYIKTCHLVKYGIGFTPLDFAETYEGFVARHHPKLGWLPSPANMDSEGSWPIPAFPDPARTPACVSLYGDSFTEGAGVDRAHAWSNVLSKFLHCRVANFGVSGYGNDQACLRFLENNHDQAKVVILGFLSENPMRNVNQLRNLIATSLTCLLKPRFVINAQGQLTLVPLPTLTERDYRALKENPGQVLTQEFFLPGGPSGYQRMKFPYTWGIFKAFPILYDSLLRHRPTYFDLFQPGHPSQAMEVTAGIMEEFSRTARQRGKQPLILVIPTQFDVLEYRQTGKWVYQPLIDLMVKKKLEFVDAGPRILKYLGDGPVETLYDPKTQNHLSEAGNRLLAKIVYDHLRQQNFNLGNHRASGPLRPCPPAVSCR
jgi:lysophospholipase L1-like esterase